MVVWPINFSTPTFSRGPPFLPQSTFSPRPPIPNRKDCLMGWSLLKWPRTEVPWTILSNFTLATKSWTVNQKYGLFNYVFNPYPRSHVYYLTVSFTFNIHLCHWTSRDFLSQSLNTSLPVRTNFSFLLPGGLQRSKNLTKVLSSPTPTSSPREKTTGTPRETTGTKKVRETTSNHRRDSVRWWQ